MVINAQLPGIFRWLPLESWFILGNKNRVRWKPWSFSYTLRYKCSLRFHMKLGGSVYWQFTQLVGVDYFIPRHLLLETSQYSFISRVPISMKQQKQIQTCLSGYLKFFMEPSHKTLIRLHYRTFWWSSIKKFLRFYIRFKGWNLLRFYLELLVWRVCCDRLNL